MSNGGDHGSGKEGDSLLRAIAHVSDRLPASDPESIAHFRIVGRLGRGGMGIVYRAEDRRLHREVALKVLPESVGVDEARRQRFLREARSAAAITHPNVATVFESGEADGRVFIAMELVEGETLRARLARGALPIGEALRIARLIARGLAKAHDRGIVHRDVKPENVMLTGDDQVKVLDFGLAKMRQEAAGGRPLEKLSTESMLTGEGGVMGTPGYMSPEQATGAQVDARTDVFALGVVLYELVTGTRPFRGATTSEAVASLLRDEPRPPSRLNASVAPDLDSLVLRCLRKMPEQRFASGGELLAALEAVSEPRKPRNRTRWMLGVAGASLALVAAYFIGARPPALSRERTAPTSGATASAPATARGIPITDHPPPKTSNPEAAGAYAAALQNLRDGSLFLAGSALRRATVLDPSYAAAHLRLVLHSDGDRRDFMQAYQFRSALDERDTALLGLADAFTAEPSDHDEEVRRATQLVDRFPLDAELACLLGASLMRGGRRGEARSAFHRALELDPQYAQSLQQEADTYFQEDEQRRFELHLRCLELFPVAASCLRNVAEFHGDHGQCAELEADARRGITLEPTGGKAYAQLASALAGRDAPPEAVRSALDRATALGGWNEAEFAPQAVEDASLAMLAGNLLQADASLAAWEAAVPEQRSEALHGDAVASRMTVALERGDSGQALRLAEDFAARAPAWVQDDPGGVRLWRVYLLHRAGRLSDPQFQEQRDALFEEAVRRSPPSPRGHDLLKLRFYLTYVETAGEAREAIARVPDGGLEPAGAWSWDAARLGSAYLLAGQPGVAIPLLRRLADSCWVGLYADHALGAEPIRYVQANFQLGQALEQTGDSPGACAAYGKVLHRWPNPKPRSVTVEKARDRAKTLKCAL